MTLLVLSWGEGEGMKDGESKNMIASVCIPQGALPSANILTTLKEEPGWRARGRSQSRGHR